ncbi:uncharacterized protein LOC128203719 [Mya arenaria]|uniref:uncharacterized protein LOC128203640 n=1 Tax=Mya arenaria TaxID=6604 RepID=UPI0022E74302|nr:uncharacterized protein LOC128203640 [Mya arenaria]XP_052761212.1 uncharacterized protein LOC128203719 [Mya arenaria]
MESMKTKTSCLYVYVWLLVFIGVCTRYSRALVTDNRIASTKWTEDDGDITESLPWQLNDKYDLLQELGRLAQAEEDIVGKIHALTADRENLRAQKRGHVQCFLNLVSCYRKRK